MSSIWQKLSKIDVNEHVKKKGQFSYLSWTWCWATIKENYPDATYKVHKDTAYSDGTYEVNVSVTIDGLRHKMWLPVMDNRNNAIANPNARDFGDTKMRCLVKAAAFHGLGHYIYAGESMPQEADPFTPEQKTAFIAHLASGDGFALKRFAHSVGNEVMSELFNAAPQGQKTKQKEIVRGYVNDANDSLKVALSAIQDAINDGSYSAIEEIYGEMGADETFFVDAGLSEIQQHAIGTLRGEA